MPETPAPLLSAADIRRIAAEIDLRPTKTLGQNYVIDPNTIRRIVAAADLSADEHVLEVGPGLGSLTLGLLDAAAAVTAVEIDPGPAERLPQTVREFRPDAMSGFSVLTADAMVVSEQDLAEVRPQTADGAPTALVANLPYNVAVPVLLHLLAELPSLRHGLVMVQEEVADRLAAAPGSKTYGVPSAKAAWYATVRKAGTIGMNVFWPAPKIHSGLVAFTPARSSRHERLTSGGVRRGGRGLRPTAQDPPSRPGRMGRVGCRSRICPGGGRGGPQGSW